MCEYANVNMHLTWRTSRRQRFLWSIVYYYVTLRSQVNLRRPLHGLEWALRTTISPSSSAAAGPSLLRILWSSIDDARRCIMSYLLDVMAADAEEAFCNVTPAYTRHREHRYSWCIWWHTYTLYTSIRRRRAPRNKTTVHFSSNQIKIKFIKQQRAWKPLTRC